jgi:hypothetical protein
VIAEIADTDEGKVLGSPGCRMGETNALHHISNFNTLTGSTWTYGQRRSAIDAREFTISSFSGQATSLGSASGRA